MKPIDVTCPTCGAPPGTRCTREHLAYVRPHVARVRAAAVLVGCLPPLGG